MENTHPAVILVAPIICCFAGLFVQQAAAEATQRTDRPHLPYAECPLLDLSRKLKPAEVDLHDATFVQRGLELRVTTGHTSSWPSFDLKLPREHRDLSAFQYVKANVKNVGRGRASVFVRIEDHNVNDANGYLDQTIELLPGMRQTFCVMLIRKAVEPFRSMLFGMAGLPGGMSLPRGVDAANITMLRIGVRKPTADCLLQVSNIVIGGCAEREPPREEAKFFPLIDQYGQYTHKDWPGKTKSLDDLAAQKDAEATDLAAHQGPEEWDEFGGWKSGPQLTATGYFRTEKRKGKWWLVDPEGRLFWSQGVDCVGSNAGHAVTPLTDRRHWFADLPRADSPLAAFYQKSKAYVGHYRGRILDTYDFTAANLLRKYGKSWPTETVQLTHRRLRSWGVNTLGAWSGREVCESRRTPYVVIARVISNTSAVLAGAEGQPRKFADVFAPVFAAEVRSKLASEKDYSASDPWCIGYFVDNEESWGDETSLAVASLRSPAEQPAKCAFLDDLKKKYGTIERLNAAWDVQHESWDSLLHSTTPPKSSKAHDDLASFYTKTAEAYFRICRAAVKEVAPHHLYLGCRFSVNNDLATRAAAKYCDIVSFNSYGRHAAALSLPPGVDMPLVIGEFAFGGCDRGMFQTGAVSTVDQKERAEAYTYYVRSALRNPCVVGAHWFQFSDQPTVGRSDGENFQFGFVDVCDKPYEEIVAACRKLAAQMYSYRNSGP